MSDFFAAFAARADEPCEVPNEAPAPGGSTRANTAQRAKHRRDAAEEARRDQTNVTAGHSMAFSWLRHGDGNFGLISCFVNGAPSALIVAAEQRGNRVAVMPLFVALTKGMRVTDNDGDVLFDGNGD